VSGQLPPIINRVTKVGAGYIYVPGTKYRCIDCTKFLPDKDSTDGKCLEFSKNDIVSEDGYCCLWSFGNGLGNVTPRGSWEPAEAGYGEDSHGTLCLNCEYMIEFKDPRCQKVEGPINPRACCNNQSPRQEADHSAKTAQDMLLMYSQEPSLAEAS